MAIPDLPKIPVTPDTLPPYKTSFSAVGVGMATPPSDKKAFSPADGAPGGNEVLRTSGITKLTPEILRQHKGVSFVGVSTVFLCHDGNSKIFLSKRSKNTRDEHGRWTPGAGGLKHGQSLVENIRRELKEENAADALKIDFLGYTDVFRMLDESTPTHWLVMNFAVLVDPRQMKINEPDMFDDSGWFTLETLPSPLHSQFNNFLKKYRTTLSKIIGENK